MNATVFHDISAERMPEFLRAGHARRHFFAHRMYRLPKCGPDAYKLGARMCGARDPSRHRELVLFAADSVIDEFPRDLFFDDDVVWHQQQFGMPGQIATANLILDGPVLRSTVHVSDIVQRVSRRRAHKTRVEKVFGGWTHMLLNGIFSFALDHGISSVQTPTAALVMANTDPARKVGPELFERIYDRPLQQLFGARQEGGWWRIEVDGARVVAPERRGQALPAGRQICLCHDIERGFGHEATEPDFAARAHQTSPRSLEEMLKVEAQAGCHATYNILGKLLNDVEDQVRAGGHAVAFHSYDHRVDRSRSPADWLHGFLARRRGVPAADPRTARQLSLCRRLDYRTKGYRPPQSRVTSELSDASLCFYNFEWLASSVPSLGVQEPQLTDGIVKIPILFDDFDLHRRRLSYQRWVRVLEGAVQKHDVAAVCLHDCYGPDWLPRYRGLLERLQGMGRLVTMNELATHVTLVNAD